MKLLCQRQAIELALVAVAGRFARFEFVFCTAIRALGVAFAGHIQVNLGMRVPDLHVGFGAWAKDAALWV